MLRRQRRSLVARGAEAGTLFDLDADQLTVVVRRHGVVLDRCVTSLLDVLHVKSDEDGHERCGEAEDDCDQHCNV